ncbi:MAG: phosphotransferase [Eubacterium sp.]|nr:phosphotransferase [Eubacterium sp.]
MKSTNENGKLTLYLEGRIDTSNAADIENEILEIMAANADTTPVFDASGLEYISSAGLRVLMKIRKKVGAPIDVEEVSLEVYEIFETTGFTDLLNVKKKLREISIEGCELIGAGGYGSVYRIDDETIVKIYHEGVKKEYIESEKKTSLDAFKMGAPTAISFDMIKCGNQYGVVYELFNAKTMAQLIKADPSRLQELGAKMALKLKEIHQIEVPAGSGFQSRKEIFSTWLETMMRDALTPEEFDKTRRFIDSIPDRNTFLHGDYNSKNIMLQDDEILLIDIGDAAYGHPIFDLAMVMLAYIVLPHSQILKEEEKVHLLGFDPELAQSLWGVMCGTYFGIQSPEEIAKFTQATQPLMFLYISYQGTSTGRSTPELSAEKILRPRFFPALESGIPMKLDF